MKDENCVFCKIVANEIPSYKIYEDEEFFCFLNIKPHTKGHSLLIPKKHFESILDTDEDIYEQIFQAAKKVAEKINAVFEPKRVAYAFAGLEVNHTHLHLFPINEIEDFNTTSAYEAIKEELLEAQELLKI